MTEYQGYCSLNVEKPESYCYAIQELLNEHIPLKNKLDKLYHLASMLAYDPTREDRLLLLEKLYNKLMEFKALIDPHSHKEDHYLFAIVADHIGRDGGPVPVMEEDHATASKNINSFTRKYKSLHHSFSEEDIRELANYICVTFHTLTDHFLKEEEIMFPIAEHVLTDVEKRNLEQVYKEISIA